MGGNKAYSSHTEKITKIKHFNWSYEYEKGENKLRGNAYIEEEMVYLGWENEGNRRAMKLHAADGAEHGRSQSEGKQSREPSGIARPYTERVKIKVSKIHTLGTTEEWSSHLWSNTARRTTGCEGDEKSEDKQQEVLGCLFSCLSNKYRKGNFEALLQPHILAVFSFVGAGTQTRMEWAYHQTLWRH